MSVNDFILATYCNAVSDRSVISVLTSKATLNTCDCLNPIVNGNN